MLTLMAKSTTTALLLRRSLAPSFRLARFSQLTSDQLAQQKIEFEELKKELFKLKEASTASGGGQEGEEDLMPPKTMTDINNVDYMMQCDRTLIDFKSEIRSMYMHEQTFERARLQQLVKKIYIPKLKAKGFASYLYAGETPANHSRYQVVENGPDKVFANTARSRDEYVLGIETSFDESAASLVNSWGEIKSNHQMTQWEQWDEFDGVQPSVAKELHEKNLPEVIKRVMEEAGLQKGDPRLKAIAVTMGPG